MKQPPGQARRAVGSAVARVVRFFGMILLGLFALLALGFGALAWRLDQGPLQIPYIASKLATLVSGQGIVVQIDQAALAWAGYKQGGGAPLFLQLHHITASNAGGVMLAQVTDARLEFPMRALFGAGAAVAVAGEGARIADADTPVSVAALFQFGFGFQVQGADLTVRLGPGDIGPPGDNLPISGGGFVLDVTRQDAVLRNGRLTLRPFGGSTPSIGFSAVAHRTKNWQARLIVTADAVQAADLQAYWPPVMAANARRWITANIQSGMARNAVVAILLTAPADLSDFEVAGLSGGFDGTGLTLRWLPAAMPITGLNGHLAVLDPDTILITESAARLGQLTVGAGSMKITGVSQDNQIGTVKLALSGRVAEAIAVLNAPPLSLLAQAPTALIKATGSVTAQVEATLPLDNRLKLANVKLEVEARLTDVAVPTPIDGLALSAGAIDLKANQSQLNAVGHAQIAGETAALSTLLVYNANPILRHAELKTVLGPTLLHRYGLDAGTAGTDAVRGTVPLDVRIDTDAAGAQGLSATADLTAAALGLPLLGWSKPAGQPGSVNMQAALDDGGLAAVRKFHASGPALNIQASLDGNVLRLDPLRIGRTDARGRITFPGPANAAWMIDLSGSSLDLRPFASQANGAAGAGTAKPGVKAAPTGPPWQADLRFSTLYLAKPPAPALRSLVITGSGAGATVHRVNMATQGMDGQPVTLVVAPTSAPGRQALRVSAGNGGDLLRVLNLYDDVQGGSLGLDAIFGGGAPIVGTVTLTKFQLLHAPAVGKILQSLTIYGAAEAAAGPGLVFSQLLAPFSISHQVLTLQDARAYSASLGFTATGTIGLADNTADLNATVVPAYALNSLPGKIPLIGKLFTAEKGGGLFALRIRITGPLGSPRVSANPFSALTPGVLRNVFGPTHPK